MLKKVVFIHYRTGEKDGVSLEIEKRAKICQSLGARAAFISGFEALKRESAQVIKEIDMKATFNKFIREDCFYQPYFEEEMTIALYSQIEAKIYKKIKKAFKKIAPDLVFVHNLFSHAYNLPATTALIKILDHYQIPTVAVNHDFWFERAQFQKPKRFFIKEILETLPPRRAYILKHQVINSLARQELLKRRQIKAQLITDYFDFSQKQPKLDSFNKDFKKTLGIGKDELIILHATRITNRKAVENAILFTKILQKKLKKPVCLLFPNFVEVDALAYFKKVKALAEKKDVKTIWAHEKFALKREEQNGIKKYSFWDSYLFADLVTYTSTWEGYGNQFVEAMFFKKLPIVFEYPVFEKDIKKDRYRYISLGNYARKRNGLCFVPRAVLKKAADKTIALLKNKKLVKKMVEKNFKIAKSRHDQSLLAKDLKTLLYS